MKILIVHNYYSCRGGEDECFDAEIGLLRSRGIQVVVHTQNSATIPGSASLSLALRSVWSREDYRAIRALIRLERPDITHVENSFPLISPAVYYASQSEGVPVVQSLHNYRLLCVNAQLARNGAVCEDCLHKVVPWPGVVHNCYSRGLAASATLATMIGVHRALRTFATKVNVYTVPTDFVREKFIEGGFPEAKMVLRPIFVASDMGMGEGRGDYALFVGRLSAEKGLKILLSAWERLGPHIRIKIVGGGPMEGVIREAAQRIPGVELLGRVPQHELRDYFKNARVLVLPSIWYEGSPAVIGEAFSAGLPVIASDLGSMSNLIDHGRTGFHFKPGDVNDLVEKVLLAFSQPPEWENMRQAARREYETKYTVEMSIQRQVEIYETLVAERSPLAKSKAADIQGDRCQAQLGGGASHP